MVFLRGTWSGLILVRRHVAMDKATQWWTVGINKVRPAITEQPQTTPCPTVPVAPPGVKVNNNINIAKDIPANNTIWINTGWLKSGSLRQLNTLAGRGGVWDYNTTRGSQYHAFANFNFGAVAA
jgi:hypothetical protein